MSNNKDITASDKNSCLNDIYTTYLEAVIALKCANDTLNQNDLRADEKDFALERYNTLIYDLVSSLSKSSIHDDRVIVRVELPRKFTFVVDMVPFDDRLVPQVFGELGVPIVYQKSEQGGKLDRFYPLEGIFSLINITLSRIEFSGDKAYVELSTQEVDSPVERYLSNNRFQLKYSPGATYLALLEQANIDDFSWLGFISASKAEFRRGVFSIGTISESKVPLIMVHGLNSDPLIWKFITISLLNNEELNQKYQIWHVYYPSGPPPFYNAMRIRRKLSELLNLIGGDAISSNAVFLGHSMGGVIAKTLTTDSEYYLWDATFSARPEELPIDESNVEDIFIFKPVFSKNTVFFLDTPHKGSNVASSPVGFLASSIIALPSSFKSVFKSFFDKIGIDKLTQEMVPFLKDYGPNSVQVLRPGHPLMEALFNLKVEGDAYSVIGSDSLTTCDGVDCQGITDGVVDYESAYLPTSIDSIIVSSSHDSFNNPETFKFISKHL